MLPVAFPKNDTQQYVQLRDTFFIKNNRNEEAVVDFSLGGYGPQTTLEKEKVPPQGINSIAYADRIKVLPDQFQWIRNGAYYKTKDQQGASFYVNAFVVESKTAIRNKKGKIVRFEKQNLDGLTRDVINVNDELIPTSYGSQFIDSDSAVGTWRYFKEDTFSLIVQRAKRVSISPQNPKAASSRISLSIKRNNAWTEVKYGEDRNQFICYIDANTDSLKLESEGLVAGYNVKYETMKETEYISLYLMEPTSEFYILNQIKLPLNYDSNKVVLLWDLKEFSALDSSVVDASSAAKSFQKMYKDLSISLYPENQYSLLVDLTRLRSSEKNKIIDELLDHSFIIKICALFLDDQFGGSHYADDLVIVQFDERANNDQIEEIAQRFNFTLQQRLSGGLMYYLKYMHPVFDLQMLRDMQALGVHPNVVSAYPNIYYTRSIEDFNEPLPDLLPIKSIRNNK